MDTITKEQRSRVMSRIRSRDTKPELLVRKRLYAAGWRFRVCDRRLPGHPDVVVPRSRTLVEVRGCFWHRHGCAKSSMPKSNVAFWMAKWSRNVLRDRRHEVEWRKLGWNVIVVWECALNAARREDTLVRICQALDLWKSEGPRKRPHRLVLPRLSPRRR
jgi:DNA mismatch endonuclease (patch repair protein)